MSRRKRELSDDERILWHGVARTTVPLRGKSLPLMSEPEPPQVARNEPPSAVGPNHPPKPVERRSEPDRQIIDAPTRAKIAKGRVRIEGKVDLHGMTQSEAHGLLLNFLHRAYASDRRHVLVVTGKGASFGSEGVLKRQVPAWFGTPPFRALVGGWHEASRQHGGAGALYVRIRRKNGP